MGSDNPASMDRAGSRVLAATGQAIGVLMLRLMMRKADPLLVGLLRVSVAALIFWLSWPFDNKKSEHPLLPDARMSMLILANGFFGLSFGVFATQGT